MLFENTGDMRFAQRHFAPRVSSYNQRGAGCLLSVAGDVDGDGDIDVFIVHKMTTTFNTLTKGTNKLFLNNNGNFTHFGDGPFAAAEAVFTMVSLADFDSDGDLDIMVSADDAPDKLYAMAHCERVEGARVGVGSACFPCPNFMRRSAQHDVCYECEPHTTTGGLPSSNRCLAPCAPGQQRATSSDVCSICPGGRFHDQVGVAGSGEHCAECSVGRYTNGATPAVDECWKCRPGSFSPSAASTNCSACAPGKYTEEDGMSGCVSCRKGGICAEAGAASATVFQPCPTGKCNL